MGVVIEICIKYPGGPTRIRGTDMALLSMILPTIVGCSALYGTLIVHYVRYCTAYNTTTQYGTSYMLRYGVSWKSAGVS
jgi:hypothetical protein